jgi:hypothetical protein
MPQLQKLSKNRASCVSPILEDSALLSLVDSFLALGDMVGKILADTSTIYPLTTTTATTKLSKS